MDLYNKVAIVTGGANGIGKALCKRFAKAGAKVMVADVLFEDAQQLAQIINGSALYCDVTQEQQIQQLVTTTIDEFGQIDLFCSNAGIAFGDSTNAASAENSQWQLCWDLHVMAHVYAARAVLPQMIAQGQGYFLQTASAAGLLSQIADAAYSTTKHAAIGFAESLAISHGDDGIKVSVLCPQYVATNLIGIDENEDLSQYTGIISPNEVAESVMVGLQEEKFLILPHPEVEEFRQHKAADYDKWLKGMRRLRQYLFQGKTLNQINFKDIMRIPSRFQATKKPADSYSIKKQ